MTRAMAGLSQAEFACRIDVDPSLISLIESGKRSPSRATLTRLADALEVPLHLLILLGAEDPDLRDISEDEMQRVARSLATILISPRPKRIT